MAAPGNTVTAAALLGGPGLGCSWTETGRGGGFGLCSVVAGLDATGRAGGAGTIRCDGAVVTRVRPLSPGRAVPVLC